MIAAKWSKRNLTLDARILVVKTFLFSIFIHVLNMVYISSEQLEVIQKLIIDFLWKGRVKIKFSTMISPFENGGLKMLHIKNMVYNLRVKWMAQLSLDRSFTWLRMIWPRIITKIPSILLQGLRHVPESCLQEMDPFYAQVL